MPSSKLLEVDIILRSLKATSYIVGGYVRDRLLELPSKDIDIVTDANYDAMSVAFKIAGWSVKEIGKQYLVLNISKEGHHFEISNFRKDTDNSGGTIGDINTDALRRDFTINALYTPIGSKAIIDPTKKGLADIQAKILRFIGKPTARIIEDPLRVVRFYRLLHTKQLIPDKQSLKAVRQNFNYAHANTSAERWRVEIERMVGL